MFRPESPAPIAGGRPHVPRMRMIVTPHPQDPDDVLIEPVTIRKMPARKIDPIRARRTTRNQLQFDFDHDEPD